MESFDNSREHNLKLKRYDTQIPVSTFVKRFFKNMCRKRNFYEICTKIDQNDFAGETEKFAPKSVDNVNKLVYKCFLPKKRRGFEWTTFNISGVEHGGLCG